mmetsp:Transcript_16575/g.29953  ORF Transcript_16575/g.29953 Transcript_16575/m.29953 type:complete len:299 (+) Transcript_16575:79-975(+)
MSYTLADSFGTCFRAGIFPSCFHGIENSTANDNAIANICNSLNHLWVRDTKANCQGQVCLGSYASNEIVQVLGKSITSSCHSSDGNTVKESRRHVGQISDSLITASRGHQGNVGQAILDASFIQLNTFFWGQVYNNETIGTGLLRLFAEFVDTVLKERIVVAHEHHRDGKSHFAGFLNHRKTLWNLRSSSFDCNLVCFLNSCTVGLWIRVRNTELNHGGAALLHGQKNRRGVFCSRVSSSDKCDKGSFAAPLGCLKGIFDATSDTSLHVCYGNRFRRCYVQLCGFNALSNSRRRKGKR